MVVRLGGLAPARPIIETGPRRVSLTLAPIIAKGIGNASDFYGRAVYYPNYGTRPPHNGRAARRSWSTLDASALSSLPQIDPLQIGWYCNEERGQCL